MVAGPLMKARQWQTEGVAFSGEAVIVNGVAGILVLIEGFGGVALQCGFLANVSVVWGSIC